MVTLTQLRKPALALFLAVAAFVGCKKSDNNVSTVNKVTTPSTARLISAPRHWRGGLLTGHGSCAGTWALNDTDFPVTYVSDSVLIAWGGQESIFGTDAFVSPSPIVTLIRKNDTVFFSYQTNGLGCYYVTTYYDTL
jgi:hypothetical protein